MGFKIIKKKYPGNKEHFVAVNFNNYEYYIDNEYLNEIPNNLFNLFTWCLITKYDSVNCRVVRTCSEIGIGAIYSLLFKIARIKNGSKVNN